MGTTQRREREKLQRRDDILNAARNLFFEKGFRDTTIDDIARATELARGTIYLYFEGKEEIYATVLEEGLDILNRLIVESHDPARDPLTNLLAGHDAFMDFHDRYPHYYNVMMLDKMQIADVLPPPLKARLDARMARMVDWIAGLLDQGVREGYFRPLPVREVAYLQMGIAQGFALMLDRCGGADPEMGRAQLRQAMHDLIAVGLVSRKTQ